MSNAAASIACFTLLEATRTRVAWTALGALLLGLVIAEFAADLALTGSSSYRSGFYATWSRLALIAIITLFVAASVVREMHDGLLELSLSRPLSRTSWFLGRMAGFSAMAVVLAVVATLPLLLMTPPLAAGYWGLSLAAELVLVAVAGLTCVVTLGQVTATVVVVAAFYLLSRAIDALVLMSRGPAVDVTSWSAPVVRQATEVVALLLPALDRYTQTAWLSAGRPGAGVLADIGLQTAIYATLLAAVGLFDLHRRNF